MQRDSDRRVSGVRRVPVERVVDVCERDAPSGAFRGRSVDISGRGMQLWASRLPDLATPLVLRFREQGQEVIAEGEVAWCNQGPDGAEFGVRFTALDSRSVQSLKLLCQPDESSQSQTAAEVPEEAEHDTDPAPPAAPLVKLHIEGLGEPMRAQVRGRGGRGLEVASGLDFLRLGRSVDVEDVAQGGRRAAHIAGVDVALDEASRVPELVVSLRYADVAETPLPEQSRPLVMGRPVREVPRSVGREPRPTSSRETPERVTEEPHRRFAVDESVESSVDTPAPDAEESALPPQTLRVAERRPAPMPVPQTAAARREEALDAVDSEPPRDGDAPISDGDEEGLETGSEHDETEGPSEVERLRERMDDVISGVSVAARIASEQAVRLGGAAASGARWLAQQAKSAAQSSPSHASSARRRTTSAAPRSALRHSPLLRQTPARAPGSAGVASRRARRSARLIIVGGLLGFAVLGASLLGLGGSNSEPSAAAAPAPEAPVAPPTVPAAGTPAAAPPVAPAAPAPGPADDGDPDDVAEVVAQVPLFGPTGLGAARTSDVSEIEARPLARAKVSDETFGDAPAARAPKTASPNEFGHGRMHLPIVYRLRLNQPGDGLRGERTPTGFDVVIPGRKAMESGTAISRRDDRIAKVVTRNGPEGTRVSFRFRGPIPAYKVRLRKDFVEFFISS